LGDFPFVKLHKELRENPGGTSHYATAEPSAGEGDAKNSPPFSGGEGLIFIDRRRALPALSCTHWWR